MTETVYSQDGHPIGIPDSDSIEPPHHPRAGGAASMVALTREEHAGQHLPVNPSDWTAEDHADFTTGFMRGVRHNRLASDRADENWQTGIQSARKKSANLLRNELIAVYRKAYAALSTPEAKSRINEAEAFGLNIVDEVNDETEAKHWYRRGLLSLTPYVACYTDGLVLKKEIEKVLRETESLGPNDG